MQIKPTNSTIFFTLEDSATGKMILPDQSFAQPFGRVKFAPENSTVCKSGDRVLINPHAAMQVPTECGTLWVIPETAIYGVYSGEPESTITLK